MSIGRSKPSARTLAIAALLATTACAATSGGGRFAPQRAHTTIPVPTPTPVGKYIKHVVVIVQENRSFENLFAGFPGADAPMSGFTRDGKRVALKAITFDGYDIAHDYRAAVHDVDGGRMDGFESNQLSDGQAGTTYPYAFLRRSLIAPYWALARQYVLADHMFPTELSESFTAHLDLIAGTANLSPVSAEVNVPSNAPWGCAAPRGTTTSLLDPQGVVSTAGPPPCFTQFATIADLLDRAKLPWRFYAPTVASPTGGWSWASFQAIRHVYFGPDRRNVVTPQTRVLADAAAGRLPAVTWVVPDGKDSDHPGARSNTGPSWVAGVVNAIGEGPQWRSTAIVIVWDDWGGWFDNVPPPQMRGPGQFVGLGIRVPCIIVSPYAKAGYVDHTQYEFGSILHFIEEAFHLGPLGPQSHGYTDTRAASLDGAFDFGQAPRAFAKIRASYPPEYFIRRGPTGIPPDND